MSRRTHPSKEKAEEIYAFWKLNGRHYSDADVARAFKIHPAILSDIITAGLYAERLWRRMEKLASGKVQDLILKEL